MKRCSACRKILWWWQIHVDGLHEDCIWDHYAQVFGELKAAAEAQSRASSDDDAS